ncbi:MAG: SOS cell division inhibitor SulA [Gammaproteobacteria bacterium]|nr:SOS cell division inhibitor SulA [Gammaproteobacteria bacterium]
MSLEPIQKLLQQSSVWRGKTHQEQVAWPTLSTGFAELDDHLPGRGWPQASVTEFLIDVYGLGELQLLLPALKKLINTDQADIEGRSTGPSAAETSKIAFINPPYWPYAPALEAAGLSLEQILLMVIDRDQNPDLSLWTAEQLARHADCKAVLLWPKQLQTGQLRRLQLAAEAGNTWLIVFRPLSAQSQSSSATLRLSLSVNAVSEKQLHIIKVRGGRPRLLATDFLTSGFKPRSWSRPPASLLTSLPASAAVNSSQTASL